MQLARNLRGYWIEPRFVVQAGVGNYLGLLGSSFYRYIKLLSMTRAVSGSQEPENEAW